MIIEKSKMTSPAEVSTNSCPRFVRNAWKKDLCSNCFKPKEEHAPPPKVEINTLLTWSLNELPPPPSILKSVASKTGKGSGVTFNSDEAEVIGYGGNDEFSDDDEDDFFDENPKYEGEDLPDSEYEKELHKLTKSNTDFNSVTENLNKDPSENTKPITPLKLGRPDLNQTPAKTVLVSVQPFGSSATPGKVNVNSTVTSTLLSKSLNSVKDGASNAKVIPKPVSENVTKTNVNTKPNDISVVTKSFPPEPKVNVASVHDGSLLNKPNSQNKIAQCASVNNVNIVNTNTSETTSPPKILSWKTLGEQKTETDSQKTETNSIEIITPVAPESPSKTPEVEIKFSNDDHDSYQVRRNNSGTSTESKSRKCLQRGNVITKSHEIVKNKIVQQNKGDLDDTLDSLVDVTDLADQNKVEVDNHVTNINIDTEVNDKPSNIFANKNTFLKKELCEKINNAINKNHKSKLDFLNKEMGESNDWVTVESVDCRSGDDAACPDSSLEDANIYACDREKIGEPDGKADSDSSEHSEPPALPKIPPPYEDSSDSPSQAPPPRSSFLHKKVPSSENLELKPKIGIKPNGLLFSIPQHFSSPTTKLNGFLNSGNKDIKINSLKIQSNYVELKKKNGDYDIVNFQKTDHHGAADNAEKVSTSSDESPKIYKEHKISSPSSSPETYKFITEPDSIYYCKDSNRRNIDAGTKTSDSNSVNSQNNSRLRTHQGKTVESGLSEMIDSKIIFDKEYENVVKSSTDSRLEPVDLYVEAKNHKVVASNEGRKSFQEDHQTYANFHDAIDRLNGLEEKFNPIYNYSRSRSNSYDENFSDSVLSRCETPDRPKRQAPMPPPTPPLSSNGKKPYPKPPVVYPKPDLDLSPPPRKSSSTDCLAEKYTSDKMAKKVGSSTAATRMRHTLKKLLRLGKEEVDFNVMTSPAPRPRPQIIHPIDYNKPGVEVLRSHGGAGNKENEREGSNGVSSTHQGKARPSKPPPPPRSASLTEIAPGDYENVATNPLGATSANAPPSLDAASEGTSSSPSPDTSASNMSLPSLSALSLLPDHTSTPLSIPPLPPLSCSYPTPASKTSGHVHSTFSSPPSVPVLTCSAPTPDKAQSSPSSTPTLVAAMPPLPPLSSPTPGPKPARPPPPKAAEYLKRQTSGSVASTNDSGDLTVSILDVAPPVKPQRTASMRDQKKSMSCPELDPKISPDYETKISSDYGTKISSDYESKPCPDYESKSGKASPDFDPSDSGHGLSRSDSEKTSNSDHLYEVINRRDSDPPSPSSDGSSSGQRSLSYQYAGSETESDIYYPYVFCGNEEGSDEDIRRVRVRRSRNVVHKTLEDNYGAVVIANHEALAQLLEQMNHTFITAPASFKPLKTSSVRFRDLSLHEARLSLAGRSYYAASYSGLAFTVGLCGGAAGFQTGQSLPPACVISPVAEFSEVVPSALLYQDRPPDAAVQASVALLPCTRLTSLPLYALPPSSSDKDPCLLLLQMVTATLSLAGCGLDSLAADLEEFLLCGDDGNILPRLCFLPSVNDQSSPRLSLCQCVASAVSLLLPTSPLSPLLLDLLAPDTILCLSQVKSVLEFWLWGPEDLRESEDKQVALQRWLDLDRATCLHSLVCSRPPLLSPPDYCHLSFLVRTNAKALMTAASLLSKIRN